MAGNDRSQTVVLQSTVHNHCSCSEWWHGGSTLYLLESHQDLTSSCHLMASILASQDIIAVIQCLPLQLPILCRHKLSATASQIPSCCTVLLIGQSLPSPCCAVSAVSNAYSWIFHPSGPKYLQAQSYLSCTHLLCGKSRAVPLHNEQ